MATTKTTRRAKVLVVDDEEPLRLTLEAILGDEFDVVTAASVGEATTALAKGGIDVLVTDYQMGDGTGDRLIEKVAREHPNISTILITGHAGSAPVRELQRSGKALVLFKPVKPDDVIGWVRNGASMARLSVATQRLKEQTGGMEIRKQPPPKTS